MYAIVDIAGKQFKVEKDRFVYAPNVAGDAGASVEFDRVLLIEDDNGVEIGTPAISGARIAGKILEHGRGDKVIVFKKKRRKGYKKIQGHRQGYTKILIEDILLKGQKASPKQKEEAPKKEVAPKKEEAPKAEAKPKKAPAADTSATQDDLKQINGLGPKFEEALHEHGITTFRQLVDLSSDEITKLSEDVDGITAEMLEDDWIPQAKELIAQSDLKQISGIGPVFEEALNERGYHTLEQISQLTEEEMEALAEIDGLTADLIKNEDWVGQAKKLLKK